MSLAVLEGERRRQLGGIGRSAQARVDANGALERADVRQELAERRQIAARVELERVSRDAGRPEPGDDRRGIGIHVHPTGRRRRGFSQR